MAPKYKVGDIVTYKPIGGPQNKNSSTGEIKQVATEDFTLGKRHIHASKDDVRYEIVNQNTGKSAGISEANIVGKA